MCSAIISILASEAVLASPTIKTFSNPEACGMSVRAALTKGNGDQVLAYVDTNADPKTMKIDFGDGPETLILKSSAAAAAGSGGKNGDALVQVYDGNKASVQLTIRSLGPCGNNPLYADSESCEYTSFAGSMAIKTAQGQKKYDVLADDGC